MLTLEEQERLAYIQGRLEEARALQLAIDAIVGSQAHLDEEASYQMGWDDGYDVGYEEGKDAHLSDHEGSTCD